MTEGRGYITISVPNNTTKEEIKEIRKQFLNNSIYKDYKLNILISGNNDIKKILKDFIRNNAF